MSALALDGGLHDGVQPVLQAHEDTPAQIAPSTYYAAKTRPASARTVRDQELTTTIKKIHAGNYGVYRARKIWHGLHRQDVAVARCTVERLMRDPSTQQRRARTGAIRAVHLSVGALPGGSARTGV